MKIKVWTKYDEGYLPSKKHKKLRYREVEEYMDAEIPEISKADLTPAFGMPGECGEEWYIIYYWNGNLWRESHERRFHVPDRKKPVSALEALKDVAMHSSRFFGRWNGDHCEERETVREKIEGYFSDYIITDGLLYEKTEEPLYCIYTFGLGHNHAGIGTSLSVTNGYNPNISKDAYFNMLEYDQAVQEALRTAEKRGDTDSYDYIRNTGQVKVYDEKYVKRCPERDHGDGDEYLNGLEKMISSSSSVLEAGAMVMAATVSNKHKQGEKT